MGKVLWIAAIVLAVWVGTEIRNNGTHGAFGGLFASEAAGEGGEALTPQERARSTAQRAHQLADERRGRLLGD